MTKGTYFGGTWGSPWGLGGGAYIDSFGRIYPQFYFGSPGPSVSSGYSPDLEGFLTGLSVAGSFGSGRLKANVGTSGSSPTAGFSLGAPGVGATYGFGPYKVPGEWNPSAAGELNGDIYNTGFALPTEGNAAQPASGVPDGSMRYLGRKVSPSTSSVFDKGTTAVPFAPANRGSPDPARLPGSSLPPQVFGLPDQSAASGDNMDDWFSRMIKPLIRP
jgi:hypothetical protein